MKILYAIQGTGNGHIARSFEIIQELQKRGDLEILISGTEFNLKTPFKCDYTLKGLNYVFGKNGGIDYLKSLKRFDIFNFLNEIANFPINKFDLIISDFEPISSWSAKVSKKMSIGLSNHAGILHQDAPCPKQLISLGKYIVKNYAPNTFDLGFNYKSLGNTIYTPIIRRKIRELPNIKKGHYTVYLPSYHDKPIIDLLSIFKRCNFQVFSRFVTQKIIHSNIVLLPINEEAFNLSITSSNGVICNAGFGVTSETLFLNKKLMVIPMKRQYEQLCNTLMLESFGVPSIKYLSEIYLPNIFEWLECERTIEVDYPNQIEVIIDHILEINTTKNYEE